MNPMYQMLSELLIDEPFKKHPNIDMLIEKPYLYLYVDNTREDDIRKNGMKLKTGVLRLLIDRIPEGRSKFYDNFLGDKELIKISLSKLKRVEDQKVKFKFHNIKNIPKVKQFDKKLAKIIEDDDLFSHMYDKDVPIEQLPQVEMSFSGKIIPSFIFASSGKDEDDQ